jgi:hypothetical protein
VPGSQALGQPSSAGSPRAILPPAWNLLLYEQGDADQIDLANQQMSDTFIANPNLDAFILVGGWAQFGPQAYAQVTDQVMAKLKEKKLVIVAGDTLPPQMNALKAGRSHAQIGQRPFEMGRRAPAVLIDLINKKPVKDPLYTGLDSAPRRTSGSVRRSSPRSRPRSRAPTGALFLSGAATPRSTDLLGAKVDEGGSSTDGPARALRNLQALRRHPGAGQRVALLAARRGRRPDGRQRRG